MPVYDYKCPQHGVFHDLATMAQGGEPCACPTCGTQSPRVIMIPPEVLAMAPGRKKAMDRNHEAQHQPIISSLDSRAEAQDRQQHAMKHGSHKKHGCGCSSGHDHNHEVDTSSLKQQVIFLPDGSKVFPSQRPWMISH